MGSCASVQKEQGSNMGYGMRLVSKAKRLFVSSPSKEKENFTGDKDPNGITSFDSFPKGDSSFGHKSPNSGSKDELFFDSKPWLDSDCEDDFFSINGDFTPSRGNTPKHPKFTPGPLNDTLNNFSLNDNFADTKLEPSPRMKLGQLFKEPQTEILNESNENEKAKNEEPIKVLADESAANSVCASNEATPFRERKKRDKVLNYVGHNCCMPGLVSNNTHLVERSQKAN